MKYFWNPLGLSRPVIGLFYLLTNKQTLNTQEKAKRLKEN
jgi:hypothetical protein